MEITKNVRLLSSTRGSYAYLILGSEPVLVDTGFPGKSTAILEELRQLGMRPGDLAHIFLTHHDPDHIGNAKALKERTGALIWAPKEDVPYIQGEFRPRGVRRVIQRIVRVDRPVVDRVYDPASTVSGIEVIPSPGHTPGHTCLRVGDVLLAGDLVMSRRGRLNPAPALLTWDRRALRDSIDAVGKKSFQWVCPAHGDPVRRGSLWDALSDRRV